jgi:Na+/H+-dicarboxylate symporter
MWLPTPIYERTPQLWLLMAVLFVVLAAYIGFDDLFTYIYVLLGVICGVRGIQVRRMRQGYRRAMQQAVETASEPAGNEV